MKTRKGNVATEISIERNLEKCDHFKPVSTGVSPLALIKGLVSLTSALLFSLSSLLANFWNVELAGISELAGIPASSSYRLQWEPEKHIREGLPKATWPVKR